MTKPVGQFPGPKSGADFGNRRKFERLELTDAAYAVDAQGRELGKVTQASGGGMMIKPKSADISGLLPKGERVTITVMEPGSQTQHTIDMVVRYSSGEQIGLEFVGGGQ